MAIADTLLSRRHLLTGAAAFGVSSTLLPGHSLAKGPMLNTQAPYFYRFKLGAFEGTVVSDGTLPLGPPGSSFSGLNPDEVARQLESNFLPLDNVVLEQNALVINTGDRIVLFDTGMGTSKMFGPTTGKLVNSLRQAGIDPASVDALVMTHAHIDHIGGVMSDAGTNHFPNAQIYISQSDYDFWTDEAKLSTPAKAFVEHARKNLVPNRDRIRFIKDGEEFLPGIQAIAAPGHTVGHTIFMISSGGPRCCATSAI